MLNSKSVVTGFVHIAWGIRSVANCTVTGVRKVRSGELHRPFYPFSFMYAIITINGNTFQSSFDRMVVGGFAVEVWVTQKRGKFLNNVLRLKSQLIRI